MMFSSAFLVQGQHLRQRGVVFALPIACHLSQYKALGVCQSIPKWTMWGSNPRPTACKTVALPTELNARAAEVEPKDYLDYPDLSKRKVHHIPSATRTIRTFNLPGFNRTLYQLS